MFGGFCFGGKIMYKPMVRSNICLNAHPQGCKQEVLNQIAYTKQIKEKTAKLSGTHRQVKNVLVLGCSTGYGLASRITAAFVRFGNAS